MALPAEAVWQVMTTGSDSNGGGFVTGGGGVDRSKTETAFASGSNLTVDASVNTDVAPDGYTPDAADVNNIIQIISGAGFTPGAYQIVSIQSGKWRLDRSPAATGTSGGVWSLGGALATPGKAGGLHVGGNLIQVASGTYTFTSGTSNISGGRIALATGLISSWTRLEGNPASHPIFQWGNDIAARITVVAGLCAVRGIHFAGNVTHTSGAAALSLSANLAEVHNCRFTNWPTLWAIIANGYSSHITDCYFEAVQGAINSPRGTVRHCVFKNCMWAVSRGVIDSDGNTLCEFDECIFTGGQRFVRLQSGSNAVFRKCIFHGLSGTGGAENAVYVIPTNSTQLDLDSCIFQDIAGYGVSGGPNGRIRIWNCAHYNCGALDNGVISEKSGTIAGTQSFFVDPANGDFNINNIAGGGALLRAATKVLAA